MASLMAQKVNNPHAMQETQGIWVQSLGQEDTREEEMATHSSILTWKIPWTEDPSGLQSTGSQRIGLNWVTEQAHLSFKIQPCKSKALAEILEITCVLSFLKRLASNIQWKEEKIKYSYLNASSLWHCYLPHTIQIVVIRLRVSRRQNSPFALS